ncbi:MAG: hypothetical protein MJE68_29290, partial [Proteobacteria bacterium]|nr:hypothetical protein [Pseudomonadota bacterium]
PSRMRRGLINCLYVNKACDDLMQYGIMNLPFSSSTAAVLAITTALLAMAADSELRLEGWSLTEDD